MKDPQEYSSSQETHTSLQSADRSELDQAVPVRPGELIDHFRVVRRLGGGGMGEVFLARDTRLGRKVALKVVRPGKLRSTEARNRFLQEAQTTARFNHPNIVTIHAVGEHHWCPYLALEYLEGQTLRERMNEGPVGTLEAMRISLAMAEALAEAHRHGVLHRDLKPDNVLIASDGRPRVLDFGLAKTVTTDRRQAKGRAPKDPAVNLGEVAGATPVSMLGGTPAYMAPEQWERLSCTPATDVWALGVILFELIEGEHPLAGHSLQEICMLVCDRSTPMPAPTSCGARFPELSQLIERCLDRRMKHRPDAEEVTDTLSRLLFGSNEPKTRERSPFRGLLPWDEHDAYRFRGRDAEVEAFVERLRREPLIPLTGPSGAGKSSFLRAGVLPRLREQGRWLVLHLRPGKEPLASLAARLLWATKHAGTEVSYPSLDDSNPPSGVWSRLAPEEEQEISEELYHSPTRLALRLADLAEQHQIRVLLLVDQLEELFTLIDDAEIQERYLTALLTSADDAMGPVRTVLCFRQDAVGRLIAASSSHEAMGRITALGVPGPEALQETLTKPVAMAGYEWEDPDLVEAMVAAVRDNPAALPLLQFAGQALWQRRDRERHLLRCAAYVEIGGVVGALAQHADGVLDTLSPAQVTIARSLFLHLVTAEGSRRILGRWTLLERFGELSEDAAQVLDRFIEERIIVVRKMTHLSADEAECELVHEALTRVWPRLAGWIEESREESAFLTEAGQAAELWERRGRRDQELWQDDALNDAWRSLQSCIDRAPPLLVEFLSRGRRRQRTAQRHRRLLAAAVVVGLALTTLVLAGLSIETSEQRERAELGRAEIQLEGARTAATRGDVLEARARLRASLETTDSAAGRLLWQQLRQSPLKWSRSLSGPAVHVTFSHDASLLAAVSNKKTVELLDINTLEPRVLRGSPEQLATAVFSNDDHYLAASTRSGPGVVWDLEQETVRLLSDERDRSTATCAVGPTVMACAAADYSINLLDIRTGELKGVLRGHQGPLQDLWLNRDCRLLASTSADGTLRVWRMSDQKPLLQVEQTTAWETELAFGHDGTLVAAAIEQEAVHVWNLRTGARVATLLPAGHGLVRSIAFSPDGALLAASREDGIIRLWSTESWQQRAELQGHTDVVSRLCFRPDSSLLASAGNDATVRLWSLPDGALLQELTGHSDQITALAFSRDGRFLASSAQDRLVRVWDTRVTTNQTVRQTLGTATIGLDISPDGQQIASGSRDGSIRLWEMASGRVIKSWPAHRGPVFAIAYLPDGYHLVSAGADNKINLWSLVESGPPEVLDQHDTTIFDLAVSRNGVWIAAARRDGAIWLLDLKRGVDRLLRVQQTGLVWACAFSSDGTRIAAGRLDGTVVELAVPSGQVLRVSPSTQVFPRGVAYGPDDRWIVISGNDGSVRVWDSSSNSFQINRHFKASAYWLDLHPKEPLVAVGLSDDTARLLNIMTGEETVLRHSSEVNRARFSPDGSLLATASDDGSVQLWQTATGRPNWRTVALLGSPPVLLTHRGWERPGQQGPVELGEAPTRWQEHLEHEARIARQSANGELLCVQTFSGSLEIWHLPTDQLQVSLERPFLEQLQASDHGCVLIGENRTVQLVRPSGEVDPLLSLGTAIAIADDQVLVAGSGQVAIFEAATGDLLHRADGPSGITALTRLDQRLVLGYEDGGLELAAAEGQRYHSLLVLRETPSAPVNAIVAGPGNTVIAAYANGVVGVWSLETGAQVAQDRLYGPADHLLLTHGRLLAASSLGDHLELSLEVLSRSRCELLQEIWREVPVVWEAGRPARQPPPPDHECSTAAGV